MNALILRALLIALMAPVARAASDAPVVEVYKSSGCECCNRWIKHLKTHGFQVIAHNTNNVAAHKQRLGVPLGMGACHTAEVAGYLVEGHVPAKDIRRLLQERPRARGLAVPGMPMGSPGMEGARRDAFEVLLVDDTGSTRSYARY